MKTNILAIDQATRETGWCVGDSKGNVIKYGSISEKGSTSPTTRIYNMVAGLLMVCAEHRCKRVIIEENTGKGGYASQRLLMSLRGAIMYAVLDRVGVEVEVIYPATVFSRLFGTKMPEREEKKNMVLNYCSMLGLDPKNDNEADAISIYKASLAWEGK